MTGIEPTLDLTNPNNTSRYLLFLPSYRWGNWESKSVKSVAQEHTAYKCRAEAQLGSWWLSRIFTDRNRRKETEGAPGHTIKNVIFRYKSNKVYLYKIYMRKTMKLWWKTSKMSNHDEAYLHKKQMERYFIFMDKEDTIQSRSQFFSTLSIVSRQSQ